MSSHFYITTLIAISILIFAVWHVSNRTYFNYTTSSLTVQTRARIELGIKYGSCNIVYEFFDTRIRIVVGLFSAFVPPSNRSVFSSFFDTPRLRTSDRTTERRPRVRSACPRAAPFRPRCRRTVPP